METEETLTQNHNHHTTHKWETRDELLLACAVKRHGLQNWTSVSMELHSKTSLPPSLTTAALCCQKYLDLHRRFASADSDSGECKPGHIPWLEELRRLRVSELKQEVQKYDLSILSLELKVKKLEEERERSLKEKESNNNHNDGDNNRTEEEREENDKILPRIQANGNENQLLGLAEESDRENRSVNESNSTGLEAKTVGDKEETAVEKTEAEEGREEESGEVESCARKKRKKGEGTAANAVAETKSEPSIGFDLDVIRGHKHGSLFQCRLQSQETDAYRNLIRQHMDLGIIQAGVERETYAKTSNLAFYRDLLLLFNNAIVFFPKGSVESSAAHEFRSLVSSEINKEMEKSDSTAVPDAVLPKPKAELERSDSLLAKHNISVPIIVCRKRSSISAKPSSLNFAKKSELQNQEGNDNSVADGPKAVEEGLLKKRSIEKPVTGTRSSRGKKNLKKLSSNHSKKQNASPSTKVNEAVTKPEAPANDKKKTETAPSEKKRRAVDFLERINNNAPAETAKISNRRSTGGQKKDKSSTVSKEEKQKDTAVKKNAGNKKKQVKEETGKSRSSTKPSKKGVESSSASKSGTEGSAKDAGKKPKKRARR